MSYRTDRTPQEILTDNILALSMLELSRQYGTEGDRVKAMKMLFLAAYDMFRDNVKALNMRFYRHQRGPYSDEARQAWEWLSAAGLLIQPGTDVDEFEVTEEGVSLADEFIRGVLSSEHNEPIRDYFEGVAVRYAAWEQPDLVRHVYNMVVRLADSGGRPRRLGAVKRGTFTHVIERTDAVLALEMDEDWHDTLEILSSPEYDRQAMRQTSDAAYDELFAEV